MLLWTLAAGNSLKEISSWFPPSHKFTQILPYHASSNSDPARTFSAAPSCHMVTQDALTFTERTWKQGGGKKKGISLQKNQGITHILLATPQVFNLLGHCKLLTTKRTSNSPKELPLSSLPCKTQPPLSLIYINSLPSYPCEDRLIGATRLTSSSSAGGTVYFVSPLPPSCFPNSHSWPRESAF